ncbi:MAG: cysteine--tRNA ligase [Actinobacteria bacterium]|nr:cysteine--tRNA ligase [Actinomycetota bacterium]
MTLAIYDTLRREKVPFETREEGRASIYVCGPTVYGDAHIGHGRFNVVFDVLHRYLRYRGYDVTYVMNITDVDDKIINRANHEGVSPFEIATRYTHRWNDVMEGLAVLPPDVQPFATGHIQDMQELIADLIEADNAYVSDGNVLFRVRSFEDYGKLSGRRIEDAQQPADVSEVVKDDPIDFALWKAAKEGEPAWPSPWGPGRPGWHIECSAMAAKHLGDAFDLHCGGVDLIFPHHENEIAQHEAARGEFARYWMHNGMLRLSDAKMARSVGNVISLEEALEVWGRGPLRVWYASASYRSPLTFDEDLVDEAATAFQRFVTFVRNARDVGADVEPETAVADRYRATFEAALDDDLNLPGGLAALHEATSDGNELLPKAQRGDEGARAAVAALGALVAELADDIMGLGIDEVLRPTMQLQRRFAPLVEDLLGRRAEAREQRDFDRADAIRDVLTRSGVIVEDRPDGQHWYLEPVGGDDDLEVDLPGADDDGSLPTANI